MSTPELSVGHGLLVGAGLQTADDDLRSRVAGRLSVARVVHRERAREIRGRAIDQREEPTTRSPSAVLVTRQAMRSDDPTVVISASSSAGAGPVVTSVPPPPASSSHRSRRRSPARRPRRGWREPLAAGAATGSWVAIGGAVREPHLAAQPVRPVLPLGFKPETRVNAGAPDLGDPRNSASVERSTALVTQARSRQLLPFCCHGALG